MAMPTSNASTIAMARPGRDLTVQAPAASAMSVIVQALAPQGFVPGDTAPDGTVRFARGRTGAGVLVEAVSEVVPAWLIPGARRQMFAFGIRARVREDGPGSSTLRLDLDRKAAAAVVDRGFEDALTAIDAALTVAGLAATWGDLTDSARERRR